MSHIEDYPWLIVLDYSVKFPGFGNLFEDAIMRTIVLTLLKIYRGAHIVKVP